MKIFIAAFFCILLTIGISHSEELDLEEYRGVVTFHLSPAKVIKVNRIIEDPKPGTSYIGTEGILFEIDESPNVMANWTVVNLKYYKYPKPKIIKYKVLSEQYQIKVNYHAVLVEIDGDLSAYIKK